jgi:electron-transferring-flavoprotein dehydrogenase
MTPQALLARFGAREAMAYDVVIVGAGPAGLASAIRLRQMAAAGGTACTVAVVEKGSEPGAHILSGAVMDPRALTELLPQWKRDGAPLLQPVTADEVLFLSAGHALRTPDWLLPDSMHNAGNYVVSLGNVVKWLAGQAEALGVEIFPGFAAAEVLVGDDGAVRGVATGSQGIGKDGEPTAAFQLGVELTAKYTLFAEGTRGQLGKQMIARYALDAGRDPQAYALGIKEVWEVDPARARPGLVVHTAGWPMVSDTFGGGFLYHGATNRVTLGLITGLDYSNPWLSPFEEMQRWKTHPAIRAHVAGGRRIGYGARAITSGGLLSLPKLVFPGGALVGCEAGTMNAARIKGSHAAIKSGMLCAEAAYQAIAAGRAHDELADYPAAFDRSWLRTELERSRNFKQWFKKGVYVATFMAGIEQWLLPRLGVVRPPWTIHHSQPDHVQFKRAADCPQIAYPRPDGKLTFDRLSSVFLSSTNHEENQPSHLTLKDARVPVATNLALYAGPESRYCPAGVYEFVPAVGGGERLQINAPNCIHCKTCDIKDPTQNIVWVAPEGGGGPNYSGM